MENIRVEIADICPSPYGYAVFVKSPEKIFVIYVDTQRGVALQSALAGERGERPFTHEFFTQILDGLECRVRDAVVYHQNDGTFFSRLNLEMSNELGVKIIEADGRPSDVLAVALRSGAPIFVTRSVLDSVADMTDAYNKIKEAEK